MKTNTVINSQNWENNLDRCRLELTEALLSAPLLYPWEPSAPEAEAFFVAQEEEFSCTEAWDGEELDENAANFFNLLGECWQTTEKPSLLKALQQKYGELVPSDWLEKIASRAQATLNTKLPALDVLVECVRPLLPGWAEADLEVFARPLVYAMRDNSAAPGQSLLESAQQKQWENLSEVEKARLSIAIAHYALSELR